MRWRFVDLKNQTEAAERKAIIAKIEAWWREFQARTGDLAALFSRESEWDLPEWMNEHLQAIHPELMWEFGPAVNTNGHRLVITPECEHHLRSLVRDILQRAPAIDGWEFYEYRLADDVEFAQRGVQGRVGCGIDDFKCRVSCGEANRIDLCFSAPSINSADDRTASNAAFVATESLLGEECLNNWIGVIEITPWPFSKGSASSIPSGARETPLFIGVDRLKENVDALVDSIQEQLPPNPHYEWTGDTGWTMWKLKPDQSDDYCEQHDLFVSKSANPLQWTSAHGGGLFCSERFSRCGETFCYVKLDGSEGMNGEEFADKADIEDAIDAVLKPAKLGCFMGGGTGLRYSYVDLAVTDVDKAIQAVRSRLQAGRVPKRSWIQFYDSDWSAEWVGIYDDSPPPPLATDE